VCGSPPKYYAHAPPAAGAKPAASHAGHAGHTAIPVGAPLPIDPSSDPSSAKQKDRPKWRDVWALLLFVANLAAFIYVSVAALTGAPAPAPFMPAALLTQWVYALLVVAAVSVVVSGIYALGMRYLTRIMINLSIIISVALMVLYAIYAFVRINVVLGIFFLLIAAFYALLLFLWRRRIAFAVVLVQTTLDTMALYPSLLLVSLVALVVTVGVAVLCTFVLVNMFDVWTGAALACVCTYYVFGYYWVIQVRAWASVCLSVCLVVYMYVCLCG
jgi:hypothetical protein